MSSQVDIRRCPKCGVDVEMTPSRIRHSRSMCTKCSNLAVKEWIADNPERAKESSRNRSRRWQKNNPDKLPTAAEKRAYDRQYNFKRKYGMSVAEFEALLATQNGACAICSDRPKSMALLHVDHDHVTGKVRGILCQRCNMALGGFNDSAERLAKAISYLQEVR